jgi:glycerol-3-phosphate dehydrogenase
VLEIVRADPSAAARLVEGLPDCEAEVRFAARFEDARSASDVLVRRTHLFWQARGQGLTAVPRVHEILARELGSDSRREGRSSEDYEREVARSRAAL